MTEPRENTHACIERAVAEFGVHMKHKLLLTRRRPHWEGCSMAMLLERLREEADELEAAIATGDRKAVVREAADCANFAMMIADNAQWAGTRAWNSHEGE